MYSTLPSFVLGFHGCDKEIGERVISGKTRLRSSQNDYDWLGNGIYFWQYSPDCAIDYANFLKDNTQRGKIKINQPFALGAIIDLGYCLNLIESKSLKILIQGYNLLCSLSEKEGFLLPENSAPPGGKDLLLRKLDCAVIETVHSYNEEVGNKQFDTVRGVFWEGKEIYPNAGFKEKNHIQVCVRNPNCIKGYFRPLKPIESHSIP